MLSIVLRCDLILWFSVSFSRVRLFIFHCHSYLWTVLCPHFCSCVSICVFQCNADYISCKLSFAGYCALSVSLSSVFYTFFLCFSQYFLHSVCLSVSLPGVARVKLTRSDKDNSLTHSVVYFSPLLFPLFHSIPLLSLTPLSSILPFNHVSWSFHFSCFYPSVLPLSFSPLAGNLFYPVISLSCCMLLHSCRLSSLSPSIRLSIYLCQSLK